MLTIVTRFSRTAGIGVTAKTFFDELNKLLPVFCRKCCFQIAKMVERYGFKPDLQFGYFLYERISLECIEHRFLEEGQ